MVLVLISPAKTLDFETRRGGLKIHRPHFADKAAELVSVAKNLSPAQLQKLMGISPKLAALNHGRFQDFNTQPQAPAILAYRGDVYQGLNADDLSDEDLTWGHDHVGILSGLYGVLQPLDAMQAYRLEMGTSPVGRHKNLYDFWGTQITDRLNKLIRKNKISAVIGCASVEYLSSVQIKDLAAPFIQCDFKEMRNGKLQTIALFSKKARGLMMRHVIEHRVTDATELKKFDSAGYKFDKTLSTDRNFIFVR